LSGTLLLLLCVVFSAAASVFLKVGGEAMPEGMTIPALISNPMIWVGGMFYASAFLGYIYVLRVVPLSLAQPVITCGVSALTALAALLFFREQISMVNWLGMLLVFVGISLLFWGRA
jgi:multidrug transporter EmrE-like cation transporter